MSYTPTDWSNTETRRLRFMTQDEASQLMDDYNLDDKARRILKPLIGTALSPSGGLPQDEPQMNLSPEQERTTALLTPPPDDVPIIRGSYKLTGTVTGRAGQVLWKAPDPDRPLWLATAWLLGASYTALAMLHGVSPQAIQQSVYRIIPRAEDRHSHRLGFRLSSESIRAYQAMFYSHITTLRTLSPINAAKFLLASMEDVEK
jgi:hypothetical protein